MSLLWPKAEIIGVVEKKKPHNKKQTKKTPPNLESADQVSGIQTHSSLKRKNKGSKDLEDMRQSTIFSSKKHLQLSQNGP